MVPCAYVVCEFVLYDDFYHSNFMKSTSIVKLESFGSSLSMDFHPIGVSIFFLNQNNHLIPSFIVQIALLIELVHLLYLIYLSLVVIEIHFSHILHCHTTHKGLL